MVNFQITNISHSKILLLEISTLALLAKWSHPNISNLAISNIQLNRWWALMDKYIISDGKICWMFNNSLFLISSLRRDTTFYILYYCITIRREPLPSAPSHRKALQVCVYLYATKHIDTKVKGQRNGSGSPVVQNSVRVSTWLCAD